MAKANNNNPHINGMWGFAGVVVAACIGAYALLHSSKASPNTQQSTKTGNNNAAGGDAIQSNGSGPAIKAGGNVIYQTIVGDTSKHKVSGNHNGPTYNVRSDHQSGGITAGVVNMINIKNAVVLLSTPKKDIQDVRSNYDVKVDTATRTIHIQPKSGSWDTVFIAVPLAQHQSANLLLTAESYPSISLSKGTFTIEGKEYYGIKVSNGPATSSRPYTLRYTKLPSELIFGDYNSALYRSQLAEH